MLSLFCYLGNRNDFHNPNGAFRPQASSASAASRLHVKVMVEAAGGASLSPSVGPINFLSFKAHNANNAEVQLRELLTVLTLLTQDGNQSERLTVVTLPDIDAA